MDLKEAQEKVDVWISRFEEGYWPPLTNLARLIEEVGELAREMNHRFGHKTKKPDEPQQDLALELADVLFVLLVIANEQGIDLDEKLEQVLDKYRPGSRGRRNSTVFEGVFAPPIPLEKRLARATGSRQRVFLISPNPEGVRSDRRS